MSSEVDAEFAVIIGSRLDQYVGAPGGAAFAVHKQSPRPAIEIAASDS